MDDRIILLSNRGPGPPHARPDRVGGDQGKGGLVGALIAIARTRPVHWISAAMDDRERALDGATLAAPSLGPGCTQRFLAVAPAVFDEYYRVVANELLWLVHHDLWPTGRSVDTAKLAAWDGYLAANLVFAEAAVAALDQTPDAPVMIHDYHLYPAAALIRERRPEALLQFFLHIPWPAPERWAALPATVRSQMLNGVLANDIVGLQTRAGVANCLATIAAVTHADVDHASATIRVGDREVWVREFAVSIDPRRMERLADAPAVAAYEAALADPRFTFCRVDRADMSKNIVRGFQGFERLLERHPELRGGVRFVAVLQDTRLAIPQYVDHRREIVAAAERINRRFATNGIDPVELVFSDDLELALAVFRCYDALVVNAVADGMNLVCKEAPIVNRRDGVLILSHRVGAHEELGHAALSVDPRDIDDHVRAYEAAIAMPADERARRQTDLRATVTARDAARWVERQLATLAAKRHEPAGDGSWPEPHDFPAPADLPL